MWDVCEKILLIEDDSHLRNTIQRILRLDNPKYQLVTATNYDDAIEALKSHQFDLIISDFMLPNLKTAIDVLHFRCQNGVASPLVVISGMSVQEYLAEMKAETYLPRFLPKPFTSDELLTLVKGRFGE